MREGIRAVAQSRLVFPAAARNDRRTREDDKKEQECVEVEKVQ